MARHEGLVVLVEGGLPGDRVLAQVVHRSRSFLRARVGKLLSPGPDRTSPPCPHFSECGGCAYQGLEYVAQLKAKRSQVIDLLERVGGFVQPPVSPTLPSPLPLLYRSRMTYQLQRVGGSAFGLHRRSRPASILEVESCLLPQGTLQDAYRKVRDLLPELPLTVHSLQVELLGGDPEDRPVAVFHGRGRPGMEVRNLARAWIGPTGPLAGVVWKSETGGTRRDHQGRMQVLAGRSHVVQKLGPYRYRVPAGCFFQGNVVLAADLFKEVARRCRADNEGVLELHSGVGSLTLFLGGMGHRVLAVEGDPSAVSAAKFNGRYNAVTGLEFRCEDVEQALHRLADSGRRFGTVVTDPPRSGLPPGTARELGRVARHSILYISCNPATLARDLREITAGKKWRLEEVLPFDLFPQTAEIECLAELRDVSDS